jgi:insulysin
MQAHHKAATRAVGQKEKKKEQIRFRKETMEKPIVDHNHYYHFELPNKLKVLLIYDESATIAQTALNVEVGSWHEPNEFPGLAHFLEHMLFLGSEQYPVMGHFDDMISNAGGMSNAYTTDENTNYYFSVASSRLNEAL